MTGKRADKTVVKLLFTTAILLAAGTCCPGAETGCSDGMAAPSRSALTRPEDTYRKTGFRTTPIPALSYSSDLGFQLGAILDAYWFGDGSTYPKYRHKLTAEACYYTKGSGIYYLFYDSEYLIRGLRFTASASYLPNTMMAFYGFNGYPAPFLRDKNAGFYAVDRNLLRIMGDLQGPIAGHLGWAAGAAFFHYATGRTRVGKYAGETTLYDLYRRYGIIYDDESGGGSHIELRAGVVYDTRDNEPDPSCGLYADLLLYGSPDIIDRRGYHYLKAAVSFRHYLPLIRGKAGFRLPSMLAGNSSRPGPLLRTAKLRHALPEANQLRHPRRSHLPARNPLQPRRRRRHGLGQRGIAAPALRFPTFRPGVVHHHESLFSTWVSSPVRSGWRSCRPSGNDASVPDDIRKAIYSGERETPHMSAGLGIKIVMNRNLVLSVEYGIPFDRRDGTNGLYLNMNYLF